MDDFTRLADTEHMLRWFSDEPYADIRSQIEGLFRQQLPDARVNHLKVTSPPQWITGARPTGNDPDKTIVVRAGVAFEFDLTVEGGGQVHDLTGVFTWAAVRLDEPGNRSERVWMDIYGTLATFGSEGELMGRVYFE